MKCSLCITIVVDPEFGDRLEALAARSTVWIVDTPSNRVAAEAEWRRRMGGDVEAVTTFKIEPGTSAETWLCAALADVDWHHGEGVQTPPYDSLEVMGTTPTPKVVEALVCLGFTQFVERRHGFFASRR